MDKVFFLSILVATVMLPWLAARDRSPSRWLRRAFLMIVAFNAFYLVAIVYVLPRIS